MFKITGYWKKMRKKFHSCIMIYHCETGKDKIQNLQHYKNTKCLLYHFVFYYWINVIIKVKNTKCQLAIILIVL
jgi:hypothetical protein